MNLIFTLKSMRLMMNSRQLGTLAYRLSFVESNPILIYEIFTKIRFVPFNIEENAEDNEIIYTGLCPEFDAIPEGEKPPKYSCASRFIGLALQKAIVKKSEADLKVVPKDLQKKKLWNL
jgi:hypothetical protein